MTGVMKCSMASSTADRLSAGEGSPRGRDATARGRDRAVARRARCLPEEDDGDPDPPARAEHPDADLPEPSVEDVAAMRVGLHERVVDGADRASHADVLTDDPPVHPGPVDPGGEPGGVVQASRLGHLPAVPLGDPGEIPVQPQTRLAARL